MDELAVQYFEHRFGKVKLHDLIIDVNYFTNSILGYFYLKDGITAYVDIQTLEKFELIATLKLLK